MIGLKKERFSELFLIILSFFLIGYSFWKPEKTMETVRESLSVFTVSVLPSLALFSVCAKILMKSGFTEKLYLLKPIASRLGMSAGGFAAFLIGSFAGFPTGASVLAELCEKGCMDRKEAESLLPFCNQAGAAFVIGTVGTSFFGDKNMGVLLFMAQTVSAFLGICLTASIRREGILQIKAVSRKKQSFFAVITESVRETALAMLSVCAFIVFFSLVTEVFSTLFLRNMGDVIRILTGGFLEISTGFGFLAKADFSWEIRLFLSGILLGAGGISVFFQALDRTESFFYEPKQYFFGKLMTMGLCPIMVLLFFVCYRWKNSLFLCFFVFFMVVILGFFGVMIVKNGFPRKFCVLENKN